MSITTLIISILIDQYATHVEETTHERMQPSDLPVLVAGGGIGGLAAALALVRRGFAVKVLEQAPEIGEIGAGIQLGPNAFPAFDALGVGEKARGRAVYTDDMVMHDALDEYLVGRIPTGEAFRQRFGNPYAVIHRVDVHLSLLEGAQETGRVEFLHLDARRSASSRTTTASPCIDQHGNAAPRPGADRRRRREVGGAPAVRGRRGARLRPRGLPRGGRQEGLPGRPAVERRQHLGRPELPPGALPAARRRAVQRGRHLPQPRAGRVGRAPKAAAKRCRATSRASARKARQLIDLPKSWKRWATADREPIGQWTFGRATLLGDAAHPTSQYLAQGACMALEDAVTLGEALRVHDNDFAKAFELYQRSRVARTARIVLSAREMGRIYHAKGVERLVRNDLWKGRTPERFYDAMEWLYGWNVDELPGRALTPTTGDTP